MGRYERDEGGLVSTLALGVIGAVIVNLGMAAGRWLEHADDRVHDVQIANEQVQQQLERAHNVGQLILNDEAHTFTFQTLDTTGVAEACTGHYEQQAEVAQVVGDLVCSQTQPAIPK